MAPGICGRCRIRCGRLARSMCWPTTPDGLRQADKIILPGVGSFRPDHAVARCDGCAGDVHREDQGGYAVPRNLPWIARPVSGRARRRRNCAGFGIFKETVVRFSGEARVPHMGWNTLEPRAECRLLKGVEPKPYVYFAHSYYAPVMEATAAPLRLRLPVHRSARARQYLRRSVPSGEVRAVGPEDHEELRGALRTCWQNGSSPAWT